MSIPNSNVWPPSAVAAWSNLSDGQATRSDYNEYMRWAMVLYMRDCDRATYLHRREWATRKMKASGG